MDKYKGFAVISNINDAIDAMIDTDSIIIKDSSEFLAAINKTNDYMKTLPISVDQYEHLSKLLVELLSIRAEDAFVQGFKMGIKVECYAKENPKDKRTHTINKYY